MIESPSRPHDAEALRYAAAVLLDTDNHSAQGAQHVAVVAQMLLAIAEVGGHDLRSWVESQAAAAAFFGSDVMQKRAAMLRALAQALATP